MHVEQRLSGRLTGQYEVATTMLLVFGIGYVVVFRAITFWDVPLWIDESWTAVLSRAPDFSSFAHQMWLDSNAPLYYAVMWLWPFKSTFGMRIPSFACMALASVVAFAWRPESSPKAAPIAWAAMLMLWPIGTLLFGDARYYALLYLLSTFQTVAFVRLDADPRRSRACLWVGLATAAILTHYFAAFVACTQGLYFLGRHRTKAIACWPALMLTAPAFAYLAWHWPRLVVYAQPGTSWYERLSVSQAINCAQYVIGGAPVSWGLLLAVLVFGYRKRPSAAALAALVPALIATVFLCVLGMMMPMLVKRYMLPLAPPALLGLVLLMRPGGYLPVALWMLANIGTIAGWKSLLVERGVFGLDRPARLAPAGARVVWWIDYPGSRVHDRAQMADMLRDAFWRNGKPLAGADWSTRFTDADAIILLRPTPKFSLMPPQGWPCRTLSTAWGESSLMCVKPQLAPPSKSPRPSGS